LDAPGVKAGWVEFRSPTYWRTVAVCLGQDLSFLVQGGPRGGGGTTVSFSPGCMDSSWLWAGPLLGAIVGRRLGRALRLRCRADAERGRCKLAGRVVKSSQIPGKGKRR
jgi:hypothetical protein